MKRGLCVCPLFALALLAASAGVARADGACPAGQFETASSCVCPSGGHPTSSSECASDPPTPLATAAVAGAHKTNTKHRHEHRHHRLQ